MYELSVSESRGVSGGIGPAIYGAIILGAKIAASPAVRSAVIGSAKWFGAGLIGGAGAMTTKTVVDKFVEKTSKKDD